MRTTPAAWSERLAAPTNLPALVTLSLTDAETLPLQRLTPTDADRRDVGRRGSGETHRFLARRALLRHWIGFRLSIRPELVEIRYDDSGRPTVAAPRAPLFCSVSARGDQTALALADRPVGVDIEPLEDGPVAWAALSPTERAAVEALPPAERCGLFLRLWTLKEAYVKALGSGLSRDPATLDIADTNGTVSLRDGADAVQVGTAEVKFVRLGDRPFVAAVVTLPGRHALP